MPRTRKRALEGFGRRLDEARKLHTPPISRQQIMTACSVSSAALYKWEASAEPAIKPRNLFDLADLLRVRPRWLAMENGPKEVELPNAATILAEDFAALPDEYQKAVRKFTDDLLDAVRAMPGLRRPVGNERVEGAGYVPMPLPAPLKPKPATRPTAKRAAAHKKGRS